MIRRLRRRHLGMMAVIVPVTGALFVAALAWRADLPGPGTRPMASSGIEGPELIWPGLPVTLRTSGNATDSRVVSFAIVGPLVVADPLLYWSRQPVEPGGALPAGARFLGALDQDTGARVTIPPGDGVVVLYSLARQEVVSSARPGP